MLGLRIRRPDVQLSQTIMNAAIKLSSPATHEFWEIPVLYEDAHLLALDKPSGLLTSPDRAEPGPPEPDDAACTRASSAARPGPRKAAGLT